jgi:hypothetical protein
VEGVKSMSIFYRLRYKGLQPHFQKKIKFKTLFFLKQIGIFLSKKEFAELFFFKENS